MEKRETNRSGRLIHTFREQLTKEWTNEQEIRNRIAMAKIVFNNKKRILCSRMKLDLRKRLVKSFVWSVLLYGSETWMMRKRNKNSIEALEMWIWKRMEGIKWIDKISYEEVFKKIKERRILLRVIKKRKGNWIGHILRGNGLQTSVLKG